jgi:hypothetical protein
MGGRERGAWDRGRQQEQGGFGSRVELAARKAKRASRQWVASARALRPKVDGWEMMTPTSEKSPGHSRGEREWGATMGTTMGSVDLQRVNSKVKLARAKKQDKEKKRKKRVSRAYGRVLMAQIALVIVGLVVVGIIIGVCVGVFGKKQATAVADTETATGASGGVDGTGSGTGTGASASAGEATSATTSVLGQCLSAWHTGSGFACSRCVPALATAPNDFTATSAADTTGVGAALQYCALMDIISAASEPQVLQKAGWGSTSACEWSGVVCDDRARVLSM